uniref:Ig-like domain-containing protein n=1 Tax=Sinocyclocheilus rhinocerous TaxID=307959 RepID=A0A673MCB1_9TELE
MLESIIFVLASSCDFQLNVKLTLFISPCTAQSLFKPSVQIKKAHLRDIIQESKVTISCVVEAPDNTKVSWLTDNVSKKASKEVKDQSNNIVSNLTLSRNDWLTLKTVVCDPTIELAVVHSVGQSSSDSQKLLCSATGFDPKIKWLSKSKEKTGGALDATMMEDGRVKVYREILVPQQEWNEGVSYTCQTDNRHSGKTAEKSTSICTGKHVKCDRNPFVLQAEVYLLGPSHNDVRSGASVILTCLVVGQSVRLFSIQWKVNGKLLNHDVYEQESKEHNNGTQSREKIMRVSVTEWNTYAVFTCEVTHFSQHCLYREYFLITNCCHIPADPKRPTVRILRPSDGDLSGLQNTNLLCLITGFFPSDISVQWHLNGTQLDASQFTNSPVVAHTSGGFAMHSALMLPASEWKDGMFSCVVSHESSQSPIIGTLENLYGGCHQEKCT